MARKVTLSGIIAILAVAGGFLISAQRNSGYMPPGISPSKWISLTESSGIVLKEPLADRDKTLNHGILMVKVRDAWREVYLETALSGLMPVKPWIDRANDLGPGGIGHATRV